MMTDVTLQISEQFQKGIHYWFIQYNPLYFFSALCVLFGMFLVSQGLAETSWELGQIVLTVVIQVYEILLIIGASLLFREAKQYRPSVILGLLAVFFLFDCTFRTEIIATFGNIGIILTIVWIVMAIVKIKALTWAFQLKVPMTVLAVPIQAAVIIAGMPYLFHLGKFDAVMLHLMATWYIVALIAFVLWKRPKLVCAITLDDWGQKVLYRATRVAGMILVGFYLYHLFAWIGMFNVSITSIHAVPFILLIAFLYKEELLVWVGGSWALYISLNDPSTVAITALIVGLVFALHAWKLRENRLYVGMVVSFHLALWTIGWQNWPLPEMMLWLNLTTAIILLLMAWRLRLITALLPLCVGLYDIVKILISLGVLGWGILFLGTGFLALFLGVAINWSQRQGNLEKNNIVEV